MSKEQSGIVKAWEATVRKSQAAARRRAHSIFATMSVAHADDDDSVSGHASGEVYHAEKVLSNGDFYTGQWSDNLPHGHGKYLWTDGCMYVGEWVRGKTNGKGRFSWPSGATYEGEFKAGYMDGKGTYTGASGDTYKGSWVMNLKHGEGTKSYANGDYYEGDWRRGFQEGQGRYQWKNGNHYIGQWRNGMISGNGTMIWANGNRYDGVWEDGLPKGNGTFRWADGSFYVGMWSKDPKEQTGTYYPSGSPTGHMEWDPQELFSVELNDCKINPGENVSILPLQKMLNWPGLDGEFLQKQPIWKPNKGNDGSVRPRRMSVDGRVNYHSWEGDGDVSFDIVDGNSLMGRDVDEGLGSLQLEDPDLTETRLQQIRLQPMKRQGETISKGHKNYELMLNLQLGIRYSSFLYTASPICLVFLVFCLSLCFVL